MARTTPLISLELAPIPKARRSSPDEDDDSPAKGFVHYLPLCRMFYHDKSQDIWYI